MTGKMTFIIHEWIKKMLDEEKIDSTLSVPLMMMVSGIEDDIEYKLEPYHEKRSGDSNRYCWKLCEEIAKVYKTTKEEIYKSTIKAMGIYEVVPIRKENVERFKEAWESKGLGNICKVIGDSKLKGFVNLKIYFGTSNYTSKEMNEYIDKLRKLGEKAGIDVLTLEEKIKLDMREKW